MIHFGTGGFRALIGQDFTRVSVEMVGAGLCQILKREKLADKPVVIGYDHRFLSPESAKWLATIFAGNEIKVLFIARACPTPMVMYAVKKLDLNLGCMVTASHNPADFNGIKLVLEGGRDADVEFTGKLEGVCNNLPTDFSDFRDSKSFNDYVHRGLIQYFDNSNEYLDNIIGFIDQSATREANLKILFDPMYGVAGPWANILLASLRCSVDFIHNHRDPLFGGQMPAPLKETTQQLQVLVPHKQYVMGIAVDGDADRIGVIDIDGTFIDCNNILALVYYYLLKYCHLKGDVVRNIGTSVMVDRIAADYGYQSYEVPVGFKYITQSMQEHDALIGGESSGGLTVRGYIKGKDSIFASVLLIEMVAKTGKTLGELLKHLQQKYGPLYQVEEEFSFEELGYDRQQLTSILTVPLVSDDNNDVRKITFADGQKIYFQGGWALARLSGTEPLLRIMCEASTSTKLSKYHKLIKRGLRF